MKKISLEDLNFPVRFALALFKIPLEDYTNKYADSSKHVMRAVRVPTEDKRGEGIELVCSKSIQDDVCSSLPGLMGNRSEDLFKQYGINLIHHRVERGTRDSKGLKKSFLHCHVLDAFSPNTLFYIKSDNVQGEEYIDPANLNFIRYNNLDNNQKIKETVSSNIADIAMYTIFSDINLGLLDVFMRAIQENDWIDVQSMVSQIIPKIDNKGLLLFLSAVSLNQYVSMPEMGDHIKDIKWNIDSSNMDASMIDVTFSDDGDRLLVSFKDISTSEFRVNHMDPVVKDVTGSLVFAIKEDYKNTGNVTGQYSNPNHKKTPTPKKVSP